MPTNEQRRETAKRKLERQLERRAEKARKQRIITIVASVVAVIAVIGGVVGGVLYLNKDSESASATASASTESSTAPAQNPPADGKLPPFVAPAGLGENCQYPASSEQASKKVNPPRTGKIPTTPPTVTASMSTNQGNLGLTLDNAKAPCTVNSFASLAQQGYFNDTPCHRLTKGGLAVLQCGDPTGSGMGGPGYQFGDEIHPELQFDRPYLLAMANAGPGTNGSQFFITSVPTGWLNGKHTIFGEVKDEASQKVVDELNAVATDPRDRPLEDVVIESIDIDEA